MSAKQRTMRVTATVTLVVFLSKAVGFIRDSMQASYFGMGFENDAYAAAYSLFYVPILLFNSCLTSTLIPLYIQSRTQRGLKRANRFIANTTNLFAAFSVVLSVLMYIFAEGLLKLVTPGFEGETLHLAVKMTRIMMPSLVFVVMSIIFSSLLNAQEEYVAAQLTGFPLSFCLIIAMLLFGRQYGIQAVAWGVFFASILQMLILVPSLSKSYRHAWRLNINDGQFKKLMRLAVPALLSMAVNEINHLIDNALASSLQPGSVAAMSWGYKLITFITGVLIVPLATVMFSKMSMCVSERGPRAVLPIVKQGMEVMAMALLPIIAIAAVLSKDIIRLAYMRGAFDENSLMLTSGVFFCYVVGVLAFGYRDFLNRAFHSLQNTVVPMVSACVTVVINVTLNFPLRALYGVNGLALSTTIASFVGVILLIIQLRARLGRMGMRQTVIELLKIGFCAILCALTCMMMDWIMPQAESSLDAFLRLAASTIVSGIVYVGGLILLRARQRHFFMGIFKR